MREPVRGTIIILNSHGIEMKRIENANFEFWEDVTNVIIGGLSFRYDGQLTGIGDSQITFSHNPEERILFLKEIDELDRYIY